MDHSLFNSCFFKSFYYCAVSYVCLCLIASLCFCVCSLSGVANSSCTSMYEKTFPIKVVQSPTHSASSGRVHRARHRCTAQEVRCQDSHEICGKAAVMFTLLLSCVFAQSVREEEKEVYRQLLTMVSGGQSSFLHNGSSHAIVRSHRDLYVYKPFLLQSQTLLTLIWVTL